MSDAYNDQKQNQREQRRQRHPEHFEKSKENKDNNKKDSSEFVKFDSGKDDWSLMPEDALREVLKVLAFGASKYGKFNWIENSEGVEWSRFLNALERHIKKFKAGADYDEDSNLHELAHVIANGLFLLTYQINDLGRDDRDFRLGKEIGKLKCLRFIKKEGSHRYYEFECGFCGSLFTSTYNNVQKGNTKSCGCQHYENSYKTHGMSDTKLYTRWRGMIDRCENDTAISYPNYGGKGIKVCDRWKIFENFYADMGEPPEDDMQIDRIDNDGDYSPENCQWLSRKDNIRKQDRISKFYMEGKSFTLTELAAKYNINPICLKKRIRMGWELNKALTTPSKKKEDK